MVWWLPANWLLLSIIIRTGARPAASLHWTLVHPVVHRPIMETTPHHGLASMHVHVHNHNHIYVDVLGKVLVHHQPVKWKGKKLPAADKLLCTVSTWSLRSICVWLCNCVLNGRRNGKVIRGRGRAPAKRATLRAALDFAWGPDSLVPALFLFLVIFAIFIFYLFIFLMFLLVSFLLFSFFLLLSVKWVMSSFYSPL